MPTMKAKRNGNSLGRGARLDRAREAYRLFNLGWWSARREGSRGRMAVAWTLRAQAWDTLTALEAPETL